MKTLRWLPIALLALPLPPAHAIDRQVPAGGSISATLAAAVSGDRVLVEQGTYFEHVTLKNGVQLRGGYDASFSDATRDPATKRTIISGSGTGPAITSGSGIGSGTIVDGFVITGGGGTPGTGMLVTGGSPVFSHNEFSGNRRPGVAGGAYVFGGSTAKFDSNVFRDNSSAGSGGGLRVESSPVVIARNLFEANVAPNAGGALYVFASAVACTSNTYRSNLSGDGGGGGVYIQHATGVKFVNEIFEDNRSLYGGGLLARDESNVTLRNATFNNCQATFSGGGVAGLTFSTLAAFDCTFDGCSAGQGGGGFWAIQCAVTVEGDEATAASATSFFNDCTAGTTGGGLSLHNSAGTVEAVRFTNCSGDSMGGGIYILGGKYVVRRNVIRSCTSVEGGGVAHHWNRPVDFPLRSEIFNNTIYDCRATGAASPGGGVSFVAPSNSNPAAFEGNIVAFIPQGACLRSKNHSGGGTTPAPAISCCTIFRSPGNTTALVFGGGCVNAWTSGTDNQPVGTVAGEGIDPLFCQAPPTDYHLQSCSPAVDSCFNCPELGRENRGAAPDNTECACGILLSLEPMSWGRTKAQYR